MSTQLIKQLEIETYYHLGVGVTIKIDYILGRISMLNNEGRPKEWVFAERQIEYMQGWQNILDAMKYAITEAEKKLAKHQKSQEKAVERKAIDLHLAIAAENKKKRV